MALFKECARVLLGLTVQKKHLEYRRVNRSESSPCQRELCLRGEGFCHIFQSGEPSKTHMGAQRNAAIAALTELKKMLRISTEEASRPTTAAATATSSQHEERSAVEASTVQFFRAAFGI